MSHSTELAVLIGDDESRYRVTERRRDTRLVAIEIQKFAPEIAEWNQIEYITRNWLDDDNDSLPTFSLEVLRLAFDRLRRVYGIDVDRVVFLDGYGVMSQSEQEVISYVGFHGEVEFDMTEIDHIDEVKDEESVEM